MKKIITLLVALLMLFAISVPVFAQGEENSDLPSLGKNYIEVIGATVPISPTPENFYPEDMEQQPGQSFDIELTYSKPENGVDVVTTQTFTGLRTNSYANLFETNVSPFWIVEIKVTSQEDIDFTDFNFFSYAQDALPHVGCYLVNDDIVSQNYEAVMPLSIKADSSVEVLKDHPQNYMKTLKYQPYLCNFIEVRVNVKAPLNVEKAEIPLTAEIDGNSYKAKYSDSYNKQSLSEQLSTAGEKTLVFEIQNDDYIDLSKISDISFLKEENNKLDMEILEVNAVLRLNTFEYLKRIPDYCMLGKMSVNGEQLNAVYNGQEIKFDKFDLTSAFDKRYVEYINGTEYVGSVFGEGNTLILVSIGALFIGICLGVVIKSKIDKNKSSVASKTE
ncbi:MAG: hypothetical protein PHV32_00795 [Eubacteriales bacterium]|nr:hypothetical protein [Eubacteriales bacterium]